MKSSAVMQAVACAGVANAMLLPCWREFNSVAYYVAEPAPAAALWATFAAVAVLTLILFVLMQILRVANRTLRGAAAGLLLGCLFLAVGHVSWTLVAEIWPNGLTLLARALSFAYPALWMLATLGIASGFVLLLARGSGCTARGFVQLGVIAAPMFAFNAFHAARSLASEPAPASVQAASAPARLPAGPVDAPRVVWIIFDEMNAEFATPEANRRLGLANLEALRRQSVYAERGALQAESDTVLALPGLLTGKSVETVRPAAADELALTVHGNPQDQHLSRMTNVLDDAAKLGGRAGIVGWFHPYCRLFATKLAACHWSPSGDVLPGSRWQAYAPHMPIAHRVWRQIARSVWSAESLVSNGEFEFQRARHLERVNQMHEAAKSMVSDRSLQLVIVHLSLPHLPGIFDARTGKIAAAPSADYAGNLKLADRFLGEYRTAIENSGLGDSTAVVVTADHVLRTTWRETAFWNEAAETLVKQSSGSVPFLVHLPRQTEAETVSRRFPALLAREVTGKVLSRELRSPSAVAEYLGQRGRS